MSSHEKLSAAANDRKARLAQLKSLKRKQAPDSEDAQSPGNHLQDDASATSTAVTRIEPEEVSVTSTYLSGRNFDPSTRNVKLGFESTPISDPTKTLEYQAEQLALATKAEQEAEKLEDKPLDLFKLQPKKPNWDLKRDLDDKKRTLDVHTENAIARLVRERVELQKKQRGGEKNEDGETVGMEGSELVEAMHLKEKEEEEDRRRDAQDEDVS
ncbi:cwf18 pre-mRNA splicing factor [Periconia macrospinosa]|uniref:Cwf18 pre-mRNA splicing factor n=1 Tax=Periconia macrospinosa TaxID=97972 RepID=A0A2V1EB62_9PLEO|nr:cwf18 pre-mRNA splicing factor [Periconia macrospinosa]